MDFFARQLSEESRQESQAGTIEQQRMKLLANPLMIDKMVAGFAESVLLPTEVGLGPTKASKFTNDVDRVTSMFNDEDPRRGIPARLKEEFTIALADPELSNYTPNELFRELAVANHDEALPAAIDFHTKKSQGWFGEADTSTTSRKPFGYDEIIAQKDVILQQYRIDLDTYRQQTIDVLDTQLMGVEAVLGGGVGAGLMAGKQFLAERALTKSFASGVGKKILVEKGVSMAVGSIGPKGKAIAAAALAGMADGIIFGLATRAMDKLGLTDSLNRAFSNISVDLPYFGETGVGDVTKNVLGLLTGGLAFGATRKFLDAAALEGAAADFVKSKILGPAGTIHAKNIARVEDVVSKIDNDAEKNITRNLKEFIKAVPDLGVEAGFGYYKKALNSVITELPKETLDSVVWQVGKDQSLLSRMLTSSEKSLLSIPEKQVMNTLAEEFLKAKVGKSLSAETVEQAFIAARQRLEGQISPGLLSKLDNELAGLKKSTGTQHGMSDVLSEVEKTDVGKINTLSKDLLDELPDVRSTVDKAVTGLDKPIKAVPKVINGVQQKEIFTETTLIGEKSGVAFDAAMGFFEKQLADADVLKGIGLAGGAGGLVYMLAPGNAEAVPMPKQSVAFVAKTLGFGEGSAANDLARVMQEKGYLPKITKYFVSEAKVPKMPVDPGSIQDMISKGLVKTDSLGAKIFGRVWYKADSLRTMFGVAPYDAMSNPITYYQLASQTGNMNTQYSIQTMNNILSLAGGKSAAKVIQKYTAPFAKRDGELLKAKADVSDLIDVKYATIENLKKSMKGLSVTEQATSNQTVKGLADEINGLKNTLAKHNSDYQAEIAEPVMKIYSKLVKKPEMGSLRVYLASDTDDMFTKYGFLTGQLSRKEREAVKLTKTLMQDYSKRIQSRGRDVISGDYMPYVQHPLVEPTIQGLKAGEEFGSGKMAYVQLQSRRFGAVPLVPDLAYTARNYFPDINRRLAAIDFWGVDKYGLPIRDAAGKTTGWKAHMDSVQKLPDGDLGVERLKNFWKRMETGASPYPKMGLLDKLAERYVMVESSRLLFLSGSVSFKHAIKLNHNFAISGAGPWLRAIKASTKVGYNELADMAGEYGKNFKLNENEAMQFARARTKAANSISSMIDLHPELSRLEGRFNKGLDYYLLKTTEVGALGVRGVEFFDRGVSVLSSLEMAANKGMSAEQAHMAVMDTILRSNGIAYFNNPEWLRSPTMRAMVLFQGTVFRIAEQNMNMLARGTAGIVRAGRVALNRNDFLQAKIAAVQAERMTKWELIKTAYNSEKDIFGTSVATQLMRKTLGLGALYSLGKNVFDVDLSSHVLHAPIIEKTGEGTLDVRTSPIVAGFLKLPKAYQSYEEGDLVATEMFSNAMKNYMKNSSFGKIYRIGQHDIPTIYNDNALKYYLATPSKSHD